MRTLFLDIASHEKVIALVDGATARVHILADHTDEAALLPAIEKLLKDNDQTFETLDRLAVVVGPGGFMSLRTGISLMNALQWQLNIPHGGIHLSGLWQARVQEKDYVWIHSTKKEAFFVRGFGSFKTLWPQAELITLGDLQKKITATTLFVGEVLPEQRAALPLLQEILDIQSLQEALSTVIEDTTFENMPVLPWYGRGA